MTVRMMTIAVRGKMTMNNAIKIFEHEKFGKVRTVMINGEAWFAGIDVAKALGYKNISRDIRRHVYPEDFQNYRNGSFETSNRGIMVINESGLYALVFGSEKPEAKEFKRWVTSEVLPTIRKYGFYASDDVLERFLNDPDMAVGAFSKLKEERDKVRALEIENRKLAEHNKYLDMITNSNDLIPISVIAADYGVSGVYMNAVLKMLGIQYRFKNSPTWVLFAKYRDMGYTQSVTYKVRGHSIIHTYWTQKGRLFLYEKLKASGILPVCERRDGNDI